MPIPPRNGVIYRGLMRAAFVACLWILPHFAFAAVVTDATILRPLLGVSGNDSAVAANRFRLSEVDGKFFVTFQAIYGRTKVHGRLERATREQLERIAEQVELVPVGAVDYYLLNPGSQYFYVRFEADGAESTDFRTFDRILHRMPYVPEFVIFERTAFGGEPGVQLHFLRRLHPEVLKVGQIFSGLHMSSERRAAERLGCAFEFFW